MNTNSRPRVEQADTMNSHQSPPESKTVTRCRKVVFVAILLYIVGGPFYGQVLRGQLAIFRSWRMFQSRGLGIYAIEFYIRRSDGSIEWVDYLKVLGYKTFTDAPMHVRRIDEEKEILQIGQWLRGYLGTEVDLRVNARIATPKGWEILYQDHPID